MSDFKKLINLDNTEIWSIDNEIKQTLIEINKYPEYQTLYSNKYETNLDNWNLGGESYLDITSKIESWQKLFDTLKEVKACSTCVNSTAIINVCEPHENPNLNPNFSIDIGCIKDPDYFRIKYLRIAIESTDLNCHNKFWKCIANAFTF